MDSTKKCVVLVPVGGAIEPGCEAGLRVLETRGYEVRRIRGYSQVDVARNELATNALRDGFDELIWIDSDVTFNADDVERLRNHNLPFVCGIYAKKNRREFACNFLPETEKVVFGAAGGLMEILYAGFGFVHTRRSLYETVQRECKLPNCNQRFRSLVVPFFMPFIIPHPDENNPDAQWYLGEDYSFCERVRQCGVKIMLDTRIRLWHVGSYSFGWEDAGSDKERFGSYTFNLAPQKTFPAAAESTLTPVQKFAKRFPWPQTKPEVPVAGDKPKVSASAESMLKDSLSGSSKVVFAVGDANGAVTQYVANQAAGATVVTIDPWSGEPNAKGDRPYNEFLSANWSIRDRVVPYRAASDAGLRELHAAGVVPDVVFIGGDKTYQGVLANVAQACLLFPKALVAGNSAEAPAVRRAVTDFSLQSNRTLTNSGSAWKLAPNVGRSVSTTVSKRFCLFTTGRAGSTSLMKALAQYDDIAVPHKQIDCEDDEILHSDHIVRYMQEYQQLSGMTVNDELSLFEAFYVANSHSPYAGFKSMPDRHRQLKEFISQENLKLITLRREDIPSTVASFLTAFDTGQWRRDGGNQTHRLTFGPQYERAAMAHLRYIERCEKLQYEMPGAIHLSYEQLCDESFQCDALDEFFQRHIQLTNPKPPTSAASYVTNWDEFCDFIRQNRQWIWK